MIVRAAKVAYYDASRRAGVEEKAVAKIYAYVSASPTTTRGSEEDEVTLTEFVLGDATNVLLILVDTATMKAFSIHIFIYSEREGRTVYAVARVSTIDITGSEPRSAFLEQPRVVVMKVGRESELRG